MVHTIKSKNVKIRKYHQCIACLRVHPPGVNMRYQVMNFEGELRYYYMCQTCVKLVNHRDYQDILVCDHEFDEGCVDELVRQEGVDSPEDLL